MNVINQRTRGLFVLVPCLIVLTVCGCRSGDKTSSQEESMPAMHHSRGVSPTAPSGDARLLDGMGNVDFAITTKSKEAQAFFNQGVAQLYGFWFPGAENSFAQAAKLDPGAAMAYWGIAMAAPGNFIPMYQLAASPIPKLAATVPPNSPEALARAAIAKAQSLRASMTPRERLYIEAIAARHNPDLPDPEAAYVRTMRRLVEAFPDDPEAKSILALALENGYDGVTKAPRGGTLESVKLLREVLAKHPNHIGANHFLIHALEGSKNLREALPVANHYAAMAPNIPHVLHMPGHVYAQLGMFDEAVKAFLVAAAKEREYMAADPQYSKLNYLHNEIFLIQVLASQGRYQDAMARIADLMSRTQGPEEREFYYRIGWFNLMKTLVRFERWNEILDGKTLPFYNQPFEAIWYQWARGLAYASTSNAAAARDSLQKMREVFQSVGLNPPPAQLQVAESELEAYIEATAGNVGRGLIGLDRSAVSEARLPYADPTLYPRPVLELLGKTALKAGDLRAAESAFRRVLENEPGSGRALWGLAKVSEGLGKKEDAAKMLAEFRRVWRGEELK
jgi:tetratricopeptide (TPR) repeat protein